MSSLRGSFLSADAVLSEINLVFARFLLHYVFSIVIMFSGLLYFKTLKRCTMAVSYKKLWKLLIDRDMKKKDLAKVADLSNYTITKMSKGENVTV